MLSPRSEGGVQSEVEGVVRGVAVDDLVDRGHRDLAAAVAHLEEAGGVGQIVEVQAIGPGPLRLQRRARRRQQGWIRAGTGHSQLGVQCVDRGVFKNRSDGKVRLETHFRIDSQPFSSSHFKHFPLDGIVFSRGVGGLRESGERLRVVMLLPVHIGFGQKIIVGLVFAAAVVGAIDLDELSFGPRSIAACQVTVGQADAYRGLRRPGCQGTLKERLRQFEFMHGQKHIGGLQPLPARSRWRLASADFHQAQRDLAPRVFPLAVLGHELADGEAHTKPVASRRR